MSLKFHSYKRFINYIVVPIIIIFVLFQRNFIHCFIDHLELGKELGGVNEIFRGKMPYKDIFMLHGPMNIYLLALAMLIFGKSLAVLRGYFFFGNIFVYIIAYFLGLSLYRRKAFAYLAAFALILETYHPYWARTWGGFRFGFGLLAILCLINFFKKEKAAWSFFSGLFTAIGLLVSFEIGVLSFLAVFFSLTVFSICGPKAAKTFNAMPLLYFLSGFFFLALPFSIYFSIKGALLPYVYTLFVIAKNHVAVWGQKGVSLTDIFTPLSLFSFNLKYIFILLLYLFAGGYLFYRAAKGKFNWRDYSILALLIYGSAMYKFSVRAILGPQFQMAMQPAVILFIFFLEKLFDKIIFERRFINSSGLFNIARFSVLVLFFLFFAVYGIFSEKRFYKDIGTWVFYLRHRNNLMASVVLNPSKRINVRPLTLERAKGVIVPLEQADEIESVTYYITSVTLPEEPVVAFPEQGIYNFLADRPIVGRFPIAGDALICEDFVEEFLRAIDKEKPKIAIMGKQLSFLAQSIQRKDEIMPEISRYIKENYDLEKSFATVDVYRLKGPH